MSFRRTVALGVVFAAVGGLAPAAEAGRPYDLNGDGRQDLVVGLPNWENAEGEEVGALMALGARRGMIRDARVLTRRSLGIPPASWRASVGLSLASADFDGDGLADLALGAPSLGEYERAEYEPRGATVIAYGARRFPGRRQLIRDHDAGSGSSFGSHVVAGNVRGEGFGDLVVGSGDLEVFSGGDEGVAPAPSFTIGRPPGGPEPGGEAHPLALGDTTGNRQVELFEASAGRQVYDEPPVPGYLAGVFDGAKRADWVAEEMPDGGPRSLALGDVDGDGYRDLVAGVPHNYRTNSAQARPPGAVMIWWGARNRLSAKPTIITQNSPGIPGRNEDGDAFGWSVAVGRLDADRYADIVVGHPYEDQLPDHESRGRVTVIRGGPAGYSRRRSRSFGLETRGVPGSVRRGDRYFGFTTSLLDLNGDRRLDAVISDSEGVGILRGTREGLSLEGAKRLTYREAGVTTGIGPSKPGADYARIGRVGSSG